MSIFEQKNNFGVSPFQKQLMKNLKNTPYNLYLTKKTQENQKKLLNQGRPQTTSNSQKNFAFLDQKNSTRKNSCQNQYNKIISARQKQKLNNENLSLQQIQLQQLFQKFNPKNTQFSDFQAVARDFINISYEESKLSNYQIQNNSNQNLNLNQNQKLNFINLNDITGNQNQQKNKEKNSSYNSPLKAVYNENNLNQFIQNKQKQQNKITIQTQTTEENQNIQISKNQNFYEDYIKKQQKKQLNKKNNSLHNSKENNNNNNNSQISEKSYNSKKSHKKLQISQLSKEIQINVSNLTEENNNNKKNKNQGTNLENSDFDNHNILSNELIQSQLILNSKNQKKYLKNQIYQIPITHKSFSFKDQQKIKQNSLNYQGLQANQNLNKNSNQKPLNSLKNFSPNAYNPQLKEKEMNKTSYQQFRQYKHSTSQHKNQHQISQNQTNSNSKANSPLKSPLQAQYYQLQNINYQNYSYKKPPEKNLNIEEFNQNCTLSPKQNFQKKSQKNHQFSPQSKEKISQQQKLDLQIFLKKQQQKSQKYKKHLQSHPTPIELVYAKKKEQELLERKNSFSKNLKEKENNQVFYQIPENNRKNKFPLPKLLKQSQQESNLIFSHYNTYRKDNNNGRNSFTYKNLSSNQIQNLSQNQNQQKESDYSQNQNQQTQNYQKNKSQTTRNSNNFQVTIFSQKQEQNQKSQIQKDLDLIHRQEKKQQFLDEEKKMKESRKQKNNLKNNIVPKISQQLIEIQQNQISSNSRLKSGENDQQPKQNQTESTNRETIQTLNFIEEQINTNPLQYQNLPKSQKLKIIMEVYNKLEKQSESYIQKHVDLQQIARDKGQINNQPIQKNGKQILLIIFIRYFSILAQNEQKCLSRILKGFDIFYTTNYDLKNLININHLITFYRILIYRDSAISETTKFLEKFFGFDEHKKQMEKQEFYKILKETCLKTPEQQENGTQQKSFLNIKNQFEIHGIFDFDPQNKNLQFLKVEKFREIFNSGVINIYEVLDQIISIPVPGKQLTMLQI